MMPTTHGEHHYCPRSHYMIERCAAAFPRQRIVRVLSVTELLVS